MGIKLNSAGKSNASSLIAAGKYNPSAKWAGVWTTEKENSVWKDGDGAAEYKKWFLANDDGFKPDVKAYYKYPFGDGSKVYRSGLIAVKQRAAQQKETDIENAADTLIQAIDKKEGDGKLFDHYDSKRLPPSILTLGTGKHLIKSAKPTSVIKSEDDPDGVITSLISTVEPDRNDDVMVPAGMITDNFIKNPIVLNQHNDQNFAVGINVGLLPTAQGVIAKTLFHRQNEDSTLLYNLYKNGFMFAFSIGFIPIEYEMVDTGEETANTYGDTTVIAPKRVCRYNVWELLEYSTVNLPMNAGALTLSMNPKEDTERIVREAIQKGIMSGSASELHVLGLDSAIKSVPISDTLTVEILSIKNDLQTIKQNLGITMETKKLSAEDVEQVKGHVKALAEHCSLHKDALALHNKSVVEQEGASGDFDKALAMHKEAMGMEDGDEKDAALEASHKAFKAIHEKSMDAAFHSQKAFGKSKDALEGVQKATKGLHDLHKGYDAWNIDDDVDAGTEPFKEDQNPGSLMPGNPANVADDPNNPFKSLPKDIGKEIGASVRGVLEEAGLVKKVERRDEANDALEYARTQGII